MHGILLRIGLAALAFAGSSCRRAAQPAGAVPEVAFSRENPRRIVFQTDWFPQAEHGGFYQALMKGYYREAGLDVTILPGGPGTANIRQIVARGDADFATFRSDSLILAIAQDQLPFTIVGAVLQHDPQALLLREESPVRSFADLNGRTIVANPGQPWLSFLEKRYGVAFNLVPNRGGFGAFQVDPSLLQQGYVTSEPFRLGELGLKVRVLPLADSGYDSYTLIFGLNAFVAANPAATRAFLQATRRGWEDYLQGDPSPAFAEIQKRNPNASAGLLTFARNELIRRSLVTGDPGQGEHFGRVDGARLRKEISTLGELGILKRPVAVTELVRPEYLSAP